MATLVSPGVSITVIDQSIAVGAGPGTVPLIFIASKENKTDAYGTVAPGTLKANAGKVYSITSQRELIQTFENPTFYSVGGTAVNGYPLNEYGLLAAYSYLGISNLVRVVRADIDMTQLQETTVQPTSPVAAGTYWLDEAKSSFGLFEKSGVVWVSKTPDFIYNASTPTTGDITAADKIAVVFDSATGIMSFYKSSISPNAWTLLNNTTLIISQVWPDLTDVGITQTYWLKTTSPAQGANIILRKMIATTGAFAQIEAPLLSDDATANVYYNTDALGSTGQIYLQPVIVPTSTTVNGLKFKLSSDVAGPWTALTGIIGSASEPTSGPTNGQLWFNSLIGINDNGTSTVDVLMSSGTDHWQNIKLQGYGTLAEAGTPQASYASAAGSPTLYPQASDPLDNVPSVTLVAGDIWVKTDASPYPVIKRWSGAVWVLVNNTDQTTPNGIIFQDARPSPLFKITGDNYVSAAGATSSGTTVTVVSTVGLVAGMVPTVTSGTGTFAANTVVTEVVNGTSFTVSIAPTVTLSGGASVVTGAYTIGTGDNNGGGNYPDLDADAPNAALYPKGFLLWNTRYSTNNVKVWDSPYVHGAKVAVADNTNSNSTGRWVTLSGNSPEGVPYMGAAAQNICVANAIKASIIVNEEARAEDMYFNLIAAPGYVEAIDSMLVLNEDRAFTAFVVGDSPFTLNPSGTSLQSWATNQANVSSSGVDGLNKSDKYLGVWYPSGLGTNVDGTDVVVPPSHMVLRSIAYNDQVAYPWFAPAGLQRGVVNNAASVGYVNSMGQYVPIKLNEGQRDILYINRINPIRTMPTGGIVIFGQKTRQDYASATDRINVVRLENHLRYILNLLAQPFLFEQNDSITRGNVVHAFNKVLSELITLRALYDFLVVCDLSNNLPVRIDRNELWIDIAIQPTKVIEFIYIPIRILNTGATLTV